MENEKVCCEAPRKTIVSTLQENSKIIYDVGSATSRVLSLLSGNRTSDENSTKEPTCMFEEVEFQNMNLKRICEILKEIEKILN